MNRRVSISLLVALVAGAGCAAPGVAPPTAARPSITPSPSTAASRPLVFIATTGLEDIQMLTSVFRHAKSAAETGRLSEVVVIVYGRAVVAFDGGVRGRPPELVTRIREAMSAGVHVLVCAHALETWGITSASLDPTPTEIVPQAIETLADYVARDAAIVRY